MDLAGAPMDVREAVAAGTVSPTQAVKLMRTVGAEAGAVIAKAKAESGGGHITAKHVAAAATVKPASKVAATAVTPSALIVEAVAIEVEPMPVATPAKPLGDALAGAVRVFLAAWDDPDSGNVAATIATMREMVA